MNRIGPKWNKSDRGRCLLSLFFEIDEMTHGSLNRSRIGPFNLTLNTTLAYIYEYSGAIGFCV